MDRKQFFERIKGAFETHQTDEQLLAANQHWQDGDKITIIDVKKYPHSPELYREAGIRFITEFIAVETENRSIGHTAIAGVDINAQIEQTINKVVPLPANFRDLERRIFMNAIDDRTYINVIESPEALVWPPEDDGNVISKQPVWERYSKRIDAKLKIRTEERRLRP